MKHRILPVILGLFFLAGVSTADELPYREGELIVRFENGALESQVRSVMMGPVSTLAVRSTISNYIVTDSRVEKDFDRLVPGLSVVKLPRGVKVEDALLQFYMSPGVRYAEPNYKYKLHQIIPQLIPSDPFFSMQWPLDNLGWFGEDDADIDAPEAWEIFPGGDGSVTVAVVDTGISTGIDFDNFHEDLLENMWVNPGEDMNDLGVPDANDVNEVDDDGNDWVDDIIGWDFASDDMDDLFDWTEDNDPADPFGHGTHVAGIIGAVGDNAVGISGVCWDVQLMALKIFADDADEENPEAVLSDIYNALDWAVNVHPPHIINASWGGGPFSEGLYESIQAVRDAGILFVAAAGNSGWNIMEFPAAYGSEQFEQMYGLEALDNIISVMATDSFDQVPSYSNYGSWVDLAAPGGNLFTPFGDNGGVLSTYPENDYAFMEGTSMAAPHVSGAAAFLWMYDPSLTYLDVKKAILISVDKIPSLQGMCATEGRLNLYNALSRLVPGRVRRWNGGWVGPVYSTIQAAINASNDGDEVIAERGHWYFENINFKNKKITVRSGNVDSYTTSVSPEDTYISGLFHPTTTNAVVRIQNGQGSESALKGFTIRDGLYGGVYCNNTSPVITDCIITNNVGYAEAYGGGIYCNNSNAEISKCDIFNNTALLGGGIYCQDDSDIIVDDTTITSNTAYSQGGGIYCKDDSDAEIDESTISSNTASYGGGIYCMGVSDVNFTICDVSNNIAGASGGGIYGSGWAGEILRSTISNNTSMSSSFGDGGGGIYLTESMGTINNCKIIDNRANFEGGGVLCNNDSETEIINNTLSGNSAEYYGGAICCDTSYPLIQNCLIVKNSVDNYLGGGIFTYNCSPQILNCTIADNSIDSIHGVGGGLGCYYNCYPDVIDCIFSGNEHAGIGIYEDEVSKPATGPQYTSQPNITFSLFYNNTEGDYVIYDDTASGDPMTIHWEQWDEIDGISVDNHDNIYTNPMFITGRLGDYYLSNYDAGQLLDADGVPVNQSENPEDATSGAVDAGSNTAANIGMDIYSTRTDNVTDDPVSLVDIGYHYDDPLPLQYYTLDAYVAPSGSGEIELEDADSSNDPDQSGDSDYKQYSHVLLTATADEPDYQFKQWHGTDDDAKIELTYDGRPLPVQHNMVIMDSDKSVTAEFETARIQLMTGTSGENGTISPSTTWPRYYPRGTVVELVAMPSNPSHVVIWSGTDDDYETSRYNTITMLDDPEVVNVEFYAPATLYVPGEYSNIQQAIDNAHDRDIVELAPTGADTPYISSWGFDIIGRAITIQSSNPDDPNVVANTVIEQQAGPGGSVQVAFLFQNVGRSAVLNGITLTNWGGVALDGTDPDPGEGIYDGGPGITNTGGTIVCISASPTIKNCVITGAQNTGGNGAGGAGGGDPHPNGGNGGWPGGAYGAGAAVLSGNPIFINCTFDDNQVIGGNGGSGGNGNDGYSGGRGGGYYYGYPIPAPWQFPPIYWDRIYKYSGLGGAVYVGPSSSAEFVDCTFTNNQSIGGLNGICGQNQPSGLIDEPSIEWKIDNLGGAVFCDDYSSVEFVDCVFADNTADTTTDPTNDDPYASYGGAVAFKHNANVTFEGCTFNGNEACIGGGLYWEAGNIQIDECSFVDNSALHGGGILFVDAIAKIARSDFSQNEATQTGSMGGAIACLGSNAMIIDCQITDNDANGSGAGIYISNKDVYGQTVGEDNTVLVKNCLITDNTARRDGGGISANWHSEPDILNCTIANNLVTGEGFEHGYGGGLSCSYGNYSNIINSIFWDNTAELGEQISIGTIFEYQPTPSTVKVTYSNIEGGPADIYVDIGEPSTPSDDSELIWDDPLDPDYPTNLTGTSSANPAFTIGPLGNRYYLSQVQAGQSIDSPCVDAGSDTAHSLDMYRHTTRTDRKLDGLNPTDYPDAIVDMGYHYILTSQIPVDFDFDDDVDTEDYERFGMHWLDSGCEFPYFCHEKDLNKDGIVNFLDFNIFADYYSEGDTTPPNPNPITWEIPPEPNGIDAIYMEATEAYDNATGSDVEYSFECTSGGGNNSGWQMKRSWEDTGLQEGNDYCYKVKTRDGNGNEGEWSVAACATLGGGVGAPSAPSNLNATAVSSSSIDLSWTDNSDDEFGFRIERRTGGAPFSEIAMVGPNINTYPDTGLQPVTTYTYRVCAYNAAGTSAYSNEASATTLEEGQQEDEEPPLPNPSQWEIDDGATPWTGTGLPQQYQAGGSYWHRMMAQLADDTTTGGNNPVEYYFECLDTPGLDSGWQLEPVYDYEVIFQVTCRYRVRTRDAAGNVGEWSSIEATFNTAQ
ncbi:S8 family serine peptidase [Planctomycetota bacterium]